MSTFAWKFKYQQHNIYNIIFTNLLKFNSFTFYGNVYEFVQNFADIYIIMQNWTNNDIFNFIQNRQISRSIADIFILIYKKYIVNVSNIFTFM